MSIEVKLSAFEGPLDLLLMLIEKNKVDIYDIPISLITDQYMEYVDAMKEQNLDTLCDFLVMASTLLDIKARMLLPKEQDENGEDIDPRNELVARLIEYQEFKLMALDMNSMYKNADAVLYREPSIPKEVKEYEVKPDLNELFKKVDLSRLQKVFESVMQRQEEKVDPVRSRFGNIRRDPVRMSDKLLYVMDYGAEHKKFSFRALLENQETKSDIVVTFLAVLELIRIGRLKAAQEDTFTEIDLEWDENCESVITKEDMKSYD